jgi:hypothetical protein
MTGFMEESVATGQREGALVLIFETAELANCPTGYQYVRGNSWRNILRLGAI